LAAAKRGCVLGLAVAGAAGGDALQQHVARPVRKRWPCKGALGRARARPAWAAMAWLKSPAAAPSAALTGAISAQRPGDRTGGNRREPARPWPCAGPPDRRWRTRRRAARAHDASACRGGAGSSAARPPGRAGCGTRRSRVPARWREAACAVRPVAGSQVRTPSRASPSSTAWRATRPRVHGMRCESQAIGLRRARGERRAERLRTVEALGTRGEVRWRLQSGVSISPVDGRSTSRCGRQHRRCARPGWACRAQDVGGRAAAGSGRGGGVLAVAGRAAMVDG
jgi:hypothetical protein